MSDTFIERYLDAVWMERGLADNSLDAYRRDLQMFQWWLDTQGGTPLEADAVHINRFFAWRAEQGVSSRSMARMLSCLRGFYQYALRELVISEDPTLNIESPKLGRKLPNVLSEDDVEDLLEAPDVDDAVGLRDKAMLELLYACGLRVTELISLRTTDVDTMQGVIRVSGKGGKERLVPMGEVASQWLLQYYAEARGLLFKQTSDICFPSLRGQA